MEYSFAGHVLLDLEIKAVLGSRSDAENVGVTMVRTNLWVQGVLLACGFRTGLRVCSRGRDRFWDWAGVGFGATEVLGGVILDVGRGSGRATESG